MGGDASPAEVEQLAAFLHKQTITPVKVGWYSGKSKLPEHFDVSHFQYIKLGPYIESLGGLKSETTNQRLYHIENGIMEDITYRFLPHHSKRFLNRETLKRSMLYLPFERSFFLTTSFHSYL